jgi:hypothetical protein
MEVPIYGCDRAMQNFKSFCWKLLEKYCKDSINFEYLIMIKKSYPSSGQHLLSSVDNAAAPWATFSLRSLDFSRLDDSISVSIAEKSFN